MINFAERTIAGLEAKFNIKLSFKSGTKFSRVVRNDGNAILLFVDASGNIFKPATFRLPAKGVRFNIATPEGFNNFITKMDQYGFALYNRI